MSFAFITLYSQLQTLTIMYSRFNLILIMQRESFSIAVNLIFSVCLFRLQLLVALPCEPNRVVLCVVLLLLACKLLLDDRWGVLCGALRNVRLAQWGTDAFYGQRN